jgi:hypothetical protein
MDNAKIIFVIVNNSQLCYSVSIHFFERLYGQSSI